MKSLTVTPLICGFAATVTPTPVVAKEAIKCERSVPVGNVAEMVVPEIVAPTPDTVNAVMSLSKLAAPSREHDNRASSRRSPSRDR